MIGVNTHVKHRDQVDNSHLEARYLLTNRKRSKRKKCNLQKDRSINVLCVDCERSCTTSAWSTIWVLNQGGRKMILGGGAPWGEVV